MYITWVSLSTFTTMTHAPLQRVAIAFVDDYKSDSLSLMNTTTTNRT